MIFTSVESLIDTASEARTSNYNCNLDIGIAHWQYQECKLTWKILVMFFYYHLHKENTRMMENTYALCRSMKNICMTAADRDQILEIIVVSQ